MLTPTNQPVQAIALPEPRVSINIRPAVPGVNDLKFIDELQKMHTRMVGWMPTGQLEAHIAGGNVLIAEEADGAKSILQPGHWRIMAYERDVKRWKSNSYSRNSRER
jgi:hypothetical protein